MLDGSMDCLTESFPATCDALARFVRALPRCRGGCLRLPPPYYEAYHVAHVAFNTLQPGTELVRHTSSDNQRIKIHCGVSNPSGVAMEIANETVRWREGACVLLDDSFEHALASEAHDKPRTILEIKLVHPDFETAMAVWDLASYEDASSREKTVENRAPLPRVVPITRRGELPED